MWYFAGIEAREKGGPLSLSLFREKRKEGEEHLVFDNGADLSFRSVQSSLEVFQKKKKRDTGSWINVALPSRMKDDI